MGDVTRSPFRSLCGGLGGGGFVGRKLDPFGGRLNRCELPRPQLDPAPPPPPPSLFSSRLAVLETSGPRTPPLPRPEDVAVHDGGRSAASLALRFPRPEPLAGGLMGRGGAGRTGTDLVGNATCT